MGSFNLKALNSTKQQIQNQELSTHRYINIMAGFEKEWGHRKAGYRKELKFFLDKQTDEYAADKVQIYKKKLEIHIKKEDPDSILKYLKKLDDTEMTIDMIKPTGIGKMVTKLRDLADPGTKVAETCKLFWSNRKRVFSDLAPIEWIK